MIRMAGAASIPMSVCRGEVSKSGSKVENLCAHREDGEQVDSVHWYLLPLIEWFADNWNPLLHEERLPRTEQSRYRLGVSPVHQVPATGDR